MQWLVVVIQFVTNSQIVQLSVFLCYLRQAAPALTTSKFPSKWTHPNIMRTMDQGKNSDSSQSMGKLDWSSTSRKNSWKCSKKQKPQRSVCRLHSMFLMTFNCFGSSLEIYFWKNNAQLQLKPFLLCIRFTWYIWKRGEGTWKCILCFGGSRHSSLQQQGFRAWWKHSTRKYQYPWTWGLFWIHHKLTRELWHYRGYRGVIEKRKNKVFATKEKIINTLIDYSAVTIT